METEVIEVENASKLVYGDWVWKPEGWMVMVLEALDAKHVEVIEDQHSEFQFSR